MYSPTVITTGAEVVPLLELSQSRVATAVLPNLVFQVTVKSLEVASGGEEPLRVAFDRVAHWASNGAQLSPTVERLVAQAKAKVAA